MHVQSRKYTYFFNRLSMLKVDNRDARTTSIINYLLIINSIINFEHIDLIYTVSLLMILNI